MTQEDKDLLLKDLCARLPYRVKYEDEYGPRIIKDLFIYSSGSVYTDHEVGNYNEIYGVELENIKPYLRPMSSMTEEEREEYYSTFQNYETVWSIESLDWLNANYFDYRGLIDKGLALEAPEGMYKEDEK